MKQQKKKKKLISWILLLSWMVFIFYMSQQTGQVYFILNLCAKFSLKSQPSIYGKYGKWIL